MVSLQEGEVKHIEGLFGGKGLLCSTPRNEKGSFSGGLKFYMMSPLKTEMPPKWEVFCFSGRRNDAVQLHSSEAGSRTNLATVRLDL